MENNALLFIAIIIFVSKILSSLFQKLNLPPILAMILIGIAIGPTGFNLITNESDIDKLEFFSKIGVIILLFLAGLETDLKEIKTIGKNSLLIALGGVILPFGLGIGLTYFFTQNLNTSLLMGLILTATSVSVYVMTLMDMGKLKTVEGGTIINAAIIDDIIGIIILSIIFGFIDSKDGNWIQIVGKISLIMGFFVSIFIIGIFLIPFVSKIISKMKVEMAIVSFTFFFMFLFAWYAEKLEIAGITGAYFAGVFIGRLKYKHTIEEGVRIIGHTLFISIFFVYIGFQTNLRDFSFAILPFTILFILIAFISKIIGSGGTAKIIGFDWKRSFCIGSGMAPRGEVALIIASIALNHGNIISKEEFTSVIIMVIITAFITPFLLKLGFNEVGVEVRKL